MAELLRRGHIATLAPQGAPNMDILIADRDGSRLFALQVKTRAAAGGDRGWHMHKKHEDIVSDHLFYVFVDFAGPLEERPACFIMPSKLVATVVRDTHAAWERNPGAKGQQRSLDNPMRRIRPDNTTIYTNEVPQYTDGWMTPYREAWSQLSP